MKIIALIILLINNVFCHAQVSLQQMALVNGRFPVGFKHYKAADKTRTYKRIFDWNNRSLAREIPISIWYPAKMKRTGSEPLRILDYMRILKEEEEWEHLPDEQILNWFYYENTFQNQQHLKEKATANLNDEPIAGKFPVIVYAPSYQASSIENFALCEFLASHGFIILSSPSRGTENRFLGGGTEKDLETQARDLEFLISVALGLKNANHDRIATIGFSFGGLSNVLTQMRNSSIKAIVSLDGSIKYQFATLQQSAFSKTEKVTVPFIHIAQKDIPAQVLIEDKIDTTLSNRFDFYDSLTNSRAFSLKFHDLTHSYFSTLGVLFQKRDKRQDKSDVEIMGSYKWLSIYTLKFMQAFLQNDKEALKFIENKPENNGVKAGLVSQTSKVAKVKEFSFEDFNEAASEGNYKNLDKLYDSVKKKYPAFVAEEGKLNNLALQLVFNPATSIRGIKVLLFAIKIYSGSANLFDSLAESYLFIGNSKMAIKNFERSLELDPQNSNAINRLKELRK